MRSVKKSSEKKPKPLPSWRIIRVKATPAEQVGVVDAPDKQTAIKLAIEKYGVKNPHHQKRLMAFRVT